VITAHRRENLGKPMTNMFRAIRRIIEETPDIKAIYLIHMNPVLEKLIKKFLVIRIELELLDRLKFWIFTTSWEDLNLNNSGGFQVESTKFRKTVLAMRDTTERPECFVAGTLKLVGTDE